MTPTRGAIAAGDAATADAAAEMLRDGGNAFDAALAALCAAPVAEPVLASLAGGGFLLAEPADGPPVLYDFFCQTPKRVRPAGETDFYPVDVDFGTTTQEFHIGMGAMATPGVVAGLFAVHHDLGSLPMARIVEPAVQLARRGAELSAVQAHILDIVQPIYLATVSATALFESAAEPGRVLREGETYRPGAMADTLEALAREGRDLFYRGAIASEFVEACAASGGMLTRADLQGYKVVRRRPLDGRFGGARVLTNPPPSSGGPLIAFALALLDGLDGGTARDDPAWLTQLADAMAATNAARTGCGLDEGCDEALVATLLSDPVVAQYRDSMRGRAQKQGGTTHVSVIDAAGNAAAMSVSNGEGCGHVLRGCGVMPNNMLGEEDINPSGFHEWRPDSRISSMMAPTLVDHADGRRTVLGSGGSNRIRTAILQVLMNVLRFGMTLPDAIAAPRIHYERGLLSVEAVGAAGGFAPDRIARFAESLPNKELWDHFSMFYGGVHAVALDSATGAFDGAGDSRRGGVYLTV
ncbi:MAG: gamma-glutamyltransferase [Alphaproteobacteria bacterium]|nr:gamma-glutamyltransferase [Alphaproteobacteria bacterium]